MCVYIYIYIHKSFSLFLLQDCESAEAESGIAQTTMGIYVIRAEGAGTGDEPTDVGVVLEGMEVLPNLKNVTLGCVMLFGLIYMHLTWITQRTLNAHSKCFRKSWWN